MNDPSSELYQHFQKVSQALESQEPAVLDDEYNRNTKIQFKIIEEKLDKLLKNEPDFTIYRKNLGKSAEARQAGNKLFSSKNHNEEIHAKILSLYTKSIALAEENSEELALGYGNRSALLIHLKKYKECLIDIDRACKITKSDELKKKLTARKHDCLLQFEKVKKNESKPVEFYFKPSKEIPCASELVTLECNEKYGRHVVATQDIQPGTVIAVEKSFVLFPITENQNFNCFHCLSPTWTGIACDYCSIVIYCSDECKEEAWQQYHDIECLVLPYLYILQDYCNKTINLSLTIRLFIKVVKMEGWSNIVNEANIVDEDKEKQLNTFFENNLFQCNKFCSIYNLADCQILPNEENHALCSKVIELLYKKTKIFYTTVRGAKFEIVDQNILSYALLILKKLRNIVEINNAVITVFNIPQKENEIIDLKGTDLGVRISAFFSLFNHNCICNVNRTFTKNQEILLYTTNFVAKGQQLFINYGISDTMNRDERKLHLKNIFNVTCDCQGCTENWPSLCSMKPDLDKQNVFKTYFELQKADLFQTFHEIMLGPDQTFFTKHTLEKVVKIIAIINKNCSGRETYGLTHCFVEYIVNFYDSSYAVKDLIFNHCYY